MSTGSGLNKHLPEPTDPNAAVAEYFMKATTHQSKRAGSGQLDPFIDNRFYRIVQLDLEGNDVDVALLDYAWVEDQNAYQVMMVGTMRPAYRLVSQWRAEVISSFTHAICFSEDSHVNGGLKTVLLSSL